VLEPTLMLDGEEAAAAEGTARSIDHYEAVDISPY
jgi:hypothetical protein